MWYDAGYTSSYPWSGKFEQCICFFIADKRMVIESSWLPGNVFHPVEQVLSRGDAHAVMMVMVMHNKRIDQHYHERRGSGRFGPRSDVFFAPIDAVQATDMAHM